MRSALTTFASFVLLSCNVPADLSSPDRKPGIRALEEVPPPCNDCILDRIVLGTENAGKVPFTTQFTQRGSRGLSAIGLTQACCHSGREIVIS